MSTPATTEEHIKKLLAQAYNLRLESVQIEKHEDGWLLITGVLNSEIDFIEIKGVINADC